jgi:hypothetical protein
MAANSDNERKANALLLRELQKASPGPEFAVPPALRLPQSSCAGHLFAI